MVNSEEADDRVNIEVGGEMRAAQRRTGQKLNINPPVQVRGVVWGRGGRGDQGHEAENAGKRGRESLISPIAVNGGCFRFNLDLMPHQLITTEFMVKKEAHFSASQR